MIRRIAHYKSFFTITLFFFISTTLNFYLHKYNAVEYVSKRQKIEKKDANLFKLFSFGQLPVTIDWLIINSFLDESVKELNFTDRTQLYFDLDLITDLDPLFFELYLAGGNLLTILKKDHLGAHDLVSKGEKFFNHELKSFPSQVQEKFWPSPWRLWITNAYIELFELGNLNQASESFSEGSKMEGSPFYLQTLVKHLNEPSGKYQVGLKLLSFLIKNSKNEKIRAELIKKRSNLLIGNYLFVLNLNFRDFLKTKLDNQSINRLTQSGREEFWKNARQLSQFSSKDPWGGDIFLNRAGKLISTTPYEGVFGLE